MQTHPTPQKGSSTETLKKALESNRTGLKTKPLFQDPTGEPSAPQSFLNPRLKVRTLPAGPAPSQPGRRAALGVDRALTPPRTLSKPYRPAPRPASPAVMRHSGLTAPLTRLWKKLIASEETHSTSVLRCGTLCVIAKRSSGSIERRSAISARQTLSSTSGNCSEEAIGGRGSSSADSTRSSARTITQGVGGESRPKIAWMGEGGGEGGGGEIWISVWIRGLGGESRPKIALCGGGGG